MNCEWLQSVCAFDCTPISGLHGEKGIEIGTPFSYADGTAITLYAMEQGEHLLLSDNGDMLAHLSAVGIKAGQRIKTLRDRMDRFGLTLTAEGDVRLFLPIKQSQFAVPLAISAMLSVVEWEREQLGIDETTQDLANEAEILLREWKPGASLERRAKIKGQSRKEHVFDFLFDGEYIDVIAPNHTATGATIAVTFVAHSDRRGGF